MTYCSFNFYLITLHLKLTFLTFLVRRLASVTLKHTAIWSGKTVKNCYKPDQTAGVDSLFSVCSNPREVTVGNNFLMNAITHFFQPPAYVFFILLDFWGHRFAAFQKTAVSQRFGHPRVLGIPIPISLAFWVSPSHMTAAFWASPGTLPGCPNP